MRINRSHAPWAIFCILATAVSALLYLANFLPHLLPFRVPLPAFFGEAPPLRRTFGGTPLGLIFGAIAFLIFLIAAALGIRKKKHLWPIGSVQFWLKAHIWLTTLTIPLVLFHCGFHFGGSQSTCLMLLYIVVMASGFFGIALQQFMPGLMKSRLPREVVFEEIPYLRGVLAGNARKIRNEIHHLSDVDARVSRPAAVDAGGGKGAADGIAVVAPDRSLRILGEFLDTHCIPYLEASRGDRHPLGKETAAGEMFRALSAGVSGQWRPKVQQLQGWCADRRNMDLQTKYQHWLHGWLFLHVPASFALIVVTAWHALVAIRFIELVR